MANFSSKRGPQGVTGAQGETGPVSDASNCPFTPAETDDWDVPPETVAEALDELAARVRILENA